MEEDPNALLKLLGVVSQLRSHLGERFSAFLENPQGILQEGIKATGKGIAGSSLDSERDFTLAGALSRAVNPHGDGAEGFQGIGGKARLGFMTGGGVLTQLGQPKADPSTFSPSEEAFNKFMGQPIEGNFIKPATEKPTQASDPEAEYFKVEGLWDAILSQEESRNAEDIYLTIKEQGPQIINGDALSEEGVALRNFTLSAGEDERGKYLSYYDRWDLDIPFVDKHIGEPFELYDRHYIDEEDTRPKKSLLALLPQNKDS